MESLRQVPGERLEDPGVRSGVDRLLSGLRDGCRGVRHTAPDRDLHNPRLPFSEAPVHQPRARHSHICRRPVHPGPGPRLTEHLALAFRHRTRGYDNAGLQASAALVRRRPYRAVLRERGVRRWQKARTYGGRGAGTGETSSTSGEELAVHLLDPPANPRRPARRIRSRGPEFLVELQGAWFHFRGPTVTVSGVGPEQMGRWPAEDQHSR